MTHPQVAITYSAGRGKYGQRYAYVRPAGKCCNRSWRCPEDLVDAIIERHFPVVQYYCIDGRTIGARNAEAALKEYWRVCEKGKVGVRFEINILENELLCTDQFPLRFGPTTRSCQ